MRRSRTTEHESKENGGGRLVLLSSAAEVDRDIGANKPVDEYDLDAVGHNGLLTAGISR